MERQKAVNPSAYHKVYKRLKHRLASFYSRCALCLCPSFDEHLLCENCTKDLPFISAACTLCGEPLPNVSICGKCLVKPPKHYDRLCSIFTYVHPIRNLLIRLKFQQDLMACRLIGQQMAKRLHLNAGAQQRPGLIIPVPLHRKRQKERGYNQSLELARPIGIALDIPIQTTACTRTKETGAQTDLSAKERRQNLKGAFCCQKRLDGIAVAIVDDVVTTGSTIDELAKTIRKAGATSVEVWCCARQTKT